MRDPKDRFDPIFRYWAERYRLDWVRVKAQALAESNMDPNAISAAGAVGLLQFMPATWREWWDRTVGIQGNPRAKPNEPEANIAAACAYLRWLYDYFDDECLMANSPQRDQVVWASYNWGVGRVRRHIRRYGKLVLSHLPLETYSYVKRIERIDRRLRDSAATTRA